MKLYKVERSYKGITDGDQKEEVVLNLTNISSITYRPARTEKIDGEDTTFPSVLYVYFYGGAQETTFYEEDADRVWKALQRFIE